MNTHESIPRHRPAVGETVTFYHPFMRRWFRDALVTQEADSFGRITLKTGEGEFMQMPWPSS